MNAKSSQTAADFDREYLAVHVRKEDLYWEQYMGMAESSTAFEEAEAAYKAYISNPAQLRAVTESLNRIAAAGEADENGVMAEERRNLEGWRRFFQAHTIESAEARRIQEELIGMESRTQKERAGLKLVFRDSAGKEQQASTNFLATNLITSPDEVVRKSSHDALLELERWVLTHGLLEQVKTRNAFARALGFPDYFAYKVRSNEDMSVEELFAVLDEFEALTRDRCFAELERLRREKGADSVLGHNLRYFTRGDAERAMDPYMPFERALFVWTKSFHNLGIRYRGASLRLDLLDRVGKYENGFMHGPVPCQWRNGTWTPARINFTSNATPNLVGSGQSGMFTLFHEGGHAAHFSNVLEGSPCFSQEYAPTSMALAETQSMFCDSLLGDAEWLGTYGRDRKGNAPSTEIIRALVVAKHPLLSFAERSILLVPVFERALYEMPDQERTPERVLALARECEQRILGVSPPPRPTLAIPHLLASEAACSYHGYLLAHMAVYQARAFFLERDGYLTDNPRIGPELSERCWAKGNAISYGGSIQNLTGEAPSGRALARECNRSTEETWAEQERRMNAARSRNRGNDRDAFELDAHITVAHGAEIIATNTSGMEAMFADFEAFVAKHWPRNDV